MNTKPKHFGLKVLIIYIMLMVFSPLLNTLLSFVIKDSTLSSRINSLLSGVFILLLSTLWLKLPLFGKVQNLKIGSISVILAAVVNVLDPGNFSGWSISNLFSALFAGFCISVMEEAAFRGPLFVWIWSKFDKNKSQAWITAIITSIIFGLFHLSNISVTGNITQGIIQACYTAVLGFVAAAIFLTTHNILFTIVMHGLYDSIALYSDPRGISVIGHNSWSWIALFIQIIVQLTIGIYLLNRLSHSNK